MSNAERTNLERQINPAASAQTMPSRGTWQGTCTESEDSSLMDQYAFREIDRMDNFYTYDVTNPGAPRLVRRSGAPISRETVFENEINEHEAEVVVLVSSAKCAHGDFVPLRIVGNAIGGTVAVFSVSAA